MNDVKVYQTISVHYTQQDKEQNLLTDRTAFGGVIMNETLLGQF
jgi:hypothetical protein